MTTTPTITRRELRQKLQNQPIDKQLENLQNAARGAHSAITAMEDALAALRKRLRDDFRKANK